MKKIRDCIIGCISIIGILGGVPLLMLCLGLATSYSLYSNEYNMTSGYCLNHTICGYGKIFCHINDQDIAEIIPGCIVMGLVSIFGIFGILMALALICCLIGLFISLIKNKYDEV